MALNPGVRLGPRTRSSRYRAWAGRITIVHVETAGYLEAVQHLPEGATLIIRRASWEDYERLLDDLRDRPRLRVSYDDGAIEVTSPLPEHEEYVRFIEDLVRAVADELGVMLEKRGSATWKRRRLAKGAEPDASFYIANAPRIIGRGEIDLDRDPPPDVVLEIDVSNESLSKFPIYAALGVPEIWRYDGATVRFYQLAGDVYREIGESRFVAGLTPVMMGTALERSKSEGQTTALHALRREWRADR
jgi:Uma2 family endonuclease